MVKTSAGWAILAAVIMAAVPAFGEVVPVSSLDVRNLPPGAHAADAAHPLTLGGKKFSAGISAGAPAKILLNLAGGATRFTATLGIDDDSPDGAAAFVITADDRRLTLPTDPTAPATATVP